jgi:sulfatase maturation enzyme AslB (radical SAM superfamily)
MTDLPPDKYHVPQWLGDRAGRRFHAMAKPAGAACNLVRTPEGEAGLNYLCPPFKKFFAHARPRAQKMARELSAPSPASSRRL